jgi:hypothetical protein
MGDGLPLDRVQGLQEIGSVGHRRSTRTLPGGCDAGGDVHRAHHGCTTAAS